MLLLAEVAEVSGLDLVTIQDHPYQARHADAWTLLSVIAARSASLRVALNVANLPLRQPVVLAKSVATLDLVTGGRVDLGLGAGGFWDPIVAAGGTRLTARAERRRAPRGHRGHPRRLAPGRQGRPRRRRAPSRQRTAPGSGAGAPGRDLGRRLQAPDAEAHRPVCRRLAPEHGLRRPRRPPGDERRHRHARPGRPTATRRRSAASTTSSAPSAAPAAARRPRPLGHCRGLGRAAGRADPRPGHEHVHPRQRRRRTTCAGSARRWHPVSGTSWTPADAAEPPPHPRRPPRRPATS